MTPFQEIHSLADYALSDLGEDEIRTSAIENAMNLLEEIQRQCQPYLNN